MDNVSTIQSPSSTPGRWWLIGSFAGGALLLVQFGMLLAALDSPLYRVTRDGVAAARAMLEQNDLSSNRWTAYLWNETRHVESGVIRHQADQCEPGWTLYSSGHDGIVIAIDARGQEVHRWHAPYGRVFHSDAAVWRGIPDHCIFVRTFHVEADGDILVQYETPVSSPNGCGLAKLDRHSNVLWTYNAFAHHDFDVADDGTIYALTHEIRNEPHPDFAHLGSPLIEDKVAVLSPEGKELASFSVFDALAGTPFHRPVVTLRDHHGDILHSNTVHVVPTGFAQKHEGVSAGDVMVCLRNLNLVVVISLQEQRAVWATSGPWHFPHDPDPLANGRILVFDNIHTHGTQALSRVVEFDPAASEIVWEFSAAEGSAPLVSQIRSGQQLLGNGNVLITESDHGRLLEVTRAGDVVWEFINPARGGDREELTAVTSCGTRYRFEELKFLSARVPASVESSGDRTTLSVSASDIDQEVNPNR